MQHWIQRSNHVETRILVSGSRAGGEPRDSAAFLVQCRFFDRVRFSWGEGWARVQDPRGARAGQESLPRRACMVSPGTRRHEPNGLMTKDFWIEIFAWWRGNTWGTRLWLRRFGESVGTDQFGNRYYRDKRSDRRYVTYNGPADASKIPPGWYGWMHHRTDILPTEENYQPHGWEKPHTGNLTGTPQAYRPDGSMLARGERPRVTGDYDAWSPE